MVHLMKRGELERGKMMPMKLKVEEVDALEEEEGPLFKRSKHAPSFQYNPLDEPTPLGLRLRKSPSLLELIQTRLSQGNQPKGVNPVKKDNKREAGTSGSIEKMKASNFLASVLRIGSWEYISRYEGDLVAKCYFAKHKLVWEVLDGSLKKKIEIQWSDIMDLKANYPVDGPGTLDVVLSRQPLFFKETDPQPRKHTLWEKTSDFTGRQASLHRHHFLQCPQGLLGKHFEKLIQCDPRLNFLSQQQEVSLDFPFSGVPVFDDPNGNKTWSALNESRPSFFDSMDAASSTRCQSPSSRNEPESVGRSREPVCNERPSSSSVIDTHAIEEMKSYMGERSNWDQIKVPGMHTAVSMSDLVSHLENRMSDQKSSDNVFLSIEERQGLEILEEINRCLLSDSHFVPASDENSLMSSVNSLRCLLQKDPPLAQPLPCKNGSSADISGMDEKVHGSALASCFATGSKAVENPEGDTEDISDSKQKPSMSRKDSIGELLLGHPRIASLPQFLCNVGRW